MKINYVNPDHVHALVELPTNSTIEQMMQLLKGGSSHWINEENLVPGRFGWGRGYGVFSVSQSSLPKVCEYIAGQEEHHKIKSFSHEFRDFVERYGMRWQELPLEQGDMEAKS